MKNKFKKIVKRQHKLALDTATVADSTIDKHLANRVSRVGSVRRFMAVWIAFFLLISGAVLFQHDHFFAQTHKSVPAKGGLFREGIIGRYNNANPIFAVGSVNSSVSELLYAGLLKHDSDGNLVGDLAEKYSVSPDNKTYTVYLRKNLKWHDDQPVTTKDILYTYTAIQNPDTRSPLQSSWKGVELKVVDAHTIQFILKGELSSFPEYLTNGILPEHIFKDADYSQLRSNGRNSQNIVGSGPFKLLSVESLNSGDIAKTSEKITLVSNEDYHLGSPNLDQYIIQTYNQESDLREDFKKNRLDAASSIQDPQKIVDEESDVKDESRTLNSQVNVFFKTSLPQFSDANMRKALVLSIDRKRALEKLGYPAKISDSPFLDTAFAYDPKKVQKTNQPEEAKKILDGLGWKVNEKTGIREKSGQKLEFSLTVRNIDEYKNICQSLAEQWKAVGVDVKLVFLEEEELRSSVSTHNYEALFAAINLGVDPDIYTYWHSSQKDTVTSSRLNLSEYSSKTADSALESGRARTDKALRSAKYAQFLSAWMADNPALTLYQPRYVFLVKDPFYGFDNKVLVNNTDRYTNIHKWAVKDKKVLKTD